MLDRILSAAFKAGSKEILVELGETTSRGHRIEVRFRAQDDRWWPAFSLEGHTLGGLLAAVRAGSTKDGAKLLDAATGASFSVDIRSAAHGESCALTRDFGDLSAAKIREGYAEGLLAELESGLSDPDWEEEYYLGLRAARSGHPDLDKAVMDWAGRFPSADPLQLAMGFLAGYWEAAEHAHLPTVDALVARCETPSDDFLQLAGLPLERLFQYKRAELSVGLRERARRVLERFLDELARTEALSPARDIPEEEYRHGPGPWKGFEIESFSRRQHMRTLKQLLAQ